MEIPYLFTHASVDGHNKKRQRVMSADKDVEKLDLPTLLMAYKMMQLLWNSAVFFLKS